VVSPHSNLFFVRDRSVAVFFLLAFSYLLSGCASVSPKSSGTPSTPSGPTAGPALSLSATSFNFNTVTVGKSATQTLHITNTGSAPLTINSLSVQRQQFTVSGPSVPATVPASQSAAYTISFTPTTTGNASASLQISSNASTTAAVVSLAGVGQNAAAAALQVSPSSINFGNVNLRNTATQTITLQNTGGASLSISGVTVSGTGFAFSNLAPGVGLSPNQSVSFQVSFHPTVAGAALGTVSILSGSLSSPTTISLSGDGVSSTSPPPAAQHSVSLAWDASSSAVAGYIVYRSNVSGSNFVPLTATIPDLAYVDITVTSGNTYYYVVTAVDSLGNESPDSKEVTAVIPSP